MYVSETVSVLETDERETGSVLRRNPDGGYGFESNMPTMWHEAENRASEKICWVEGTVSVSF